METELEKSNLKRAKDWAIRGFQLHRFYLDHWDSVMSISKHYGVNMNRISPVMTNQTYELINVAKDITEKIKKDKQIREMASECSFPIRSTFYDSDNQDEIIDGVIFLTIYRALCEFCVSLGKELFCSYLENGNSKQELKKLFLVKGVTIRDTEKDIKVVVKEILKDLNKKPYNSKL